MQCPAFDVNSVCAGFVFALSAAQGMMLASPKQYRHALVIGADAFSKILNWDDRRTCVYFGDGAGAVLLSQTNTGHSQMHFQLGSDGRGSHHIEVPTGGPACPSTRRCSRAGLTSSRWMARRFGISPSKWSPRSFGSLLGQHDLEPQDLDMVILHQSNLRMIEAVMKSLGLPMSKTVTTLEKYGNTAAASIPITLKRAIENDRLHAGSRVLLCGFGGGLS